MWLRWQMQYCRLIYLAKPRLILIKDLIGVFSTCANRRTSSYFAFKQLLKVRCASIGYQKDLSKFIPQKSWEARAREARNSSRWITSGRLLHWLNLHSFINRWLWPLGSRESLKLVPPSGRIHRLRPDMQPNLQALTWKCPGSNRITILWSLKKLGCDTYS